mgnify:CR=1 FL=1
MTKEEVINKQKALNDHLESLKTLDEIIDWYIPPTCKVGFEREMMIKYAELYAKKCLEVARQSFWERNEWTQSIDDSITNIKLPEHE